MSHPDPAPAADGDWDIAFADDFTDGLDTSTWSTGFGWGSKTNYSPSVMDPDNVAVEGDQLVLSATGTPQSPRVGGVNTKGKVTFAPPCYLQARLSPMQLEGGCTSAWWSKPNSEAWPPEIDFMEHPTARQNQTMHNIHYSGSGTVGDGSTHKKATNGNHFYGEPASAAFHVYGVEWRGDRIAHYIDGEHLGTTTGWPATACARGAPFYMMLNVLVGGWPPGTIPPASQWAGQNTMTVDWVRIWEPAAGETADSDHAAETDPEPEPAPDPDAPASQYLVVDGSPFPGHATYTFDVTGDVEKHPAGSINAHDTVVAGVETTSVSGRVIGGRDAYRYDGRLTRLEFDGHAVVRLSETAPGPEPDTETDGTETGAD